MKNIIGFVILFFIIMSCEKDSAIPIIKTNPNIILLKTDVIDAEYSKIKESLVYISSNPSTLNVFNTNSEKTESIPLNYPPTCVSVAQDGETAVVGHDGYITYLNLTTKTILNSYSISCVALDIVIGNNKWAYVFPKEGQWTYIRSVNMNLSYDNEAKRSIYNQIYQGTIGRLHPSGNYIYTANGSSQSTIEKFHIQNGDINDKFQSSFQGIYSNSPNIWFSEDGRRVFTEKKLVLKTSDINSLDMSYNGTIDPNTNFFIKWFDFSTTKNSFYVIASEGDYSYQKIFPHIFIYNASNLVFMDKLELEKTFISDNKGGGTNYASEPNFVFSNSLGNCLYTITKAVSPDLINQWAIQKIAIN
ncbi:hypothetical protein [Flavobacterium limnophilum]|uniref:hypothetical protein n=1 Tax=Flavobacterium limnophilum TaxID=3003262 RepID=UPI002482D33E|nr:hypothetical protein [Flavobacterium limnophilum]